MQDESIGIVIIWHHFRFLVKLNPLIRDKSLKTHFAVTIIKLPAPIIKEAIKLS